MARLHASADASTASGSVKSLQPRFKQEVASAGTQGITLLRRQRGCHRVRWIFSVGWTLTSIADLRKETDDRPQSFRAVPNEKTTLFLTALHFHDSEP